MIEIKEVLPLSVAIIGIVGGLVAASKAVTEMVNSNKQRREDMRWKQAEMAKKCLDEIYSNNLAQAAMNMLDWSGRTYNIPSGGKTGPIDCEGRRMALRTENTIFTPEDNGEFIRDSFDALFDGFERLEHFISINLIRFSDVQQPLEYYVAKLAGPEDFKIIQAFLQTYYFRLAQRFLERFPQWKNHLSTGA